MGLSLSELLDAPARVTSYRVDELLEGSELSVADKETFSEAVRNPKLKSTRLETVMAQFGVSCSRTAIDNWRRANGVTC